MSLINDALKRASEAQASAAQRPRGPKGVEDLPAPMTPVAARERPTWLPVAGIALIVVALLGASGYFFMQWWKERQSWQPYATEDLDEHGFPRTNKPVAKAVSPGPVSTNKGPAPPIPAVTNPPVTTNLVAGTNPVVSTNLAVTPPVVEPAKTNPPVVATVTNPPPPILIPTPPVPKATNPAVVVEVPTPPVNPPTTKVGETNVASVTPPPVKPVIPPPDATKQGDGHTNKVAEIEFPDLKLQGISRRKNKTYAILNGKTLTAGDRIEGVMLLKIDSDSVTIEKAGLRRELYLLR